MMSRTKLNDGRINQKIRTRNALLDAAIQLLDKGLNPTIDEIAEEAKVSRATAYRYFPNIEKLLLESSLDKKFKSSENVLSGKESSNAVEKMTLVHDHLFDFVADNEIGFRLFLKACMDEYVETKGKSKKLKRGGRRLELIESALEKEKDKITEKEYDKLRFSIASMTSVEAFVALKDVCCLSQKEAKETMKWAIQKLVKSVLEDK